MDYSSIVDYLRRVTDILGNWAYMIIFLAAFLESSAFLGLLVPGETAVVVAGFLSAQGYLGLADCLAAVSLGAVLGDSVGYVLGKKVGRGYFERHEKLVLIKRKHLDKVDSYFRAHGGKTIFFGRFIGILRALAPFVAGMGGMHYGRFASYNVAGGILWAVSFTLLGYFFGQSWHLVEKWAGRAGLLILVFFLVLLGFSYLFKLLARRQKEFFGWFRARYARFMAREDVRGFLARHPAAVSFFRERLTPGRYLLYHFPAGFVLSAVSVWIFETFFTEGLVRSSFFIAVNRFMQAQVLYFETPAVTRIMEAVNRIGGGWIVTAGSLLLISYLLLARKFVFITGYVTALAGGNMLAIISRYVLGRKTGPSLWVLHRVLLPGSYIMTSLIFYGMAAYIIIRSIRRWEFRLLAAFSAVFVALCVGVSRIYLRMASPLELLVTMANGLFFLFVWITGLEIYVLKSRRKPEA
ncbi:MAG: VTT domain-containing protein [Nitrospiraceae bacterium]|nr:VTT domain-containing protein [Nitrospiraceae bacterium]